MTRHSGVHTGDLELGGVLGGLKTTRALLCSRYHREMSLAYQRVSSGGTVIETACGRIQYAEFGDGLPMLIVHGAGGGYDQGEYFARLIGGGYRWIALRTT
jgi:hypothetical protein